MICLYFSIIAIFLCHYNIAAYTPSLALSQSHLINTRMSLSQAESCDSVHNKISPDKVIVG